MAHSFMNQYEGMNLWIQNSNLFVKYETNQLMRQNFTRILKALSHKFHILLAKTQ